MLFLCPKVILIISQGNHCSMRICGHVYWLDSRWIYYHQFIFVVHLNLFGCNTYQMEGAITVYFYYFHVFWGRNLPLERDYRIRKKVCLKCFFYRFWGDKNKNKHKKRRCGNVIRIVVWECRQKKKKSVCVGKTKTNRHIDIKEKRMCSCEFEKLFWEKSKSSKWCRNR